MPKSRKAKKQTLHIRNMVGSSCIRAVESILKGAGAELLEKTNLGKAVIAFDPKEVSLQDISRNLGAQGFELLKDKEDQIVEQTKVAAIELVYHAVNANSLIRNSDHLSERLGMPYGQLSKIFSEKTGSTLEKYIILLKIEKVKELLSYNELTLSEISYQMGYSSVQYLSTQFKQVTGYTVSEYRNQGVEGRRPLDKLI